MDKQQPPPYMGLDNDYTSHAYAPSPNMGGPSYSPQQPGYPYTPPQQPVIQPPSSLSTTVVVNSGGVGGCPVCHNKSWTGTYGCCAWLWCIFCFPVGIICCCCLRKKKCSKCGFTVG